MREIDRIWLAQIQKAEAIEAAERHESMNTYVIKQLGLVDA